MVHPHDGRGLVVKRSEALRRYLDEPAEQATWDARCRRPHTMSFIDKKCLGQAHPLRQKDEGWGAAGEGDS